MIEVELPDGSIAEFPDGTAPDVMKDALQKKFGGPKTALGQVGDFVGGVVNDVVGAVRGTQDPAENDTSVFDPMEANFVGADTDGLAAMNRAGFHAITDEALADVTAKQLGGQFVRQEKDANGYPIIVFRDQKGQEQRRYINRPGLDFQDVSRGLQATVPYLVGGGAVATGAKAAGLGLSKAAQAVAQGGTAAAVSGGQDVVASSQGSEQGFDVGRAVATGLLGAAAPYASVPRVAAAGGAVIGGASEGTLEERVAKGLIGGATGYAAGKSVNRLLRGRDPAQAVEGGRIADPALRARAQQSGLNVDDLSPQEAQDFARAAARSKNDAEIATSIETGRFGIPTTKGTRTKDMQQLVIEQDARYGNIGPDAQRIIKEFDQLQANEIKGSALGRAPEALSGTAEEIAELQAARAAGVPGSPQREGMGAMIAPQRAATRPSDVESGVLGESIQSGLKSVKKAGDEAINQAFKQVDEIVPSSEAFKSLPKIVSSKLGNKPIDNELTPASMKMAKDLSDFMENRAISPASPSVIQRGAVKDVDAVRRRLLSLRSSAQNDTDRGAAKAIYDGFNDWIDDIADKGMIQGSAAPEKAAALRTARTITREVKSLFDPMGRGGKKNPSSRILNEIVDGENNADNVIQVLFGGQGPQSVPKTGSVGALKQIKKALTEGIETAPGKRSKLASSEDALRTWNDIRMAYWSRLVVGKNGQMNSPQVISQNIRKAMSRQRDMVRTLYSPNELNIMGRYIVAMEKSSAPMPNSSNTSFALRAALKNETNIAGRAGKQAAQTQMKRETFSNGRHILAAFWRNIAREFPTDIGGFKSALRERTARKAVSQTIDLLPGPSQAGIKAGAGAVADQQQLTPFN